VSAGTPTLVSSPLTTSYEIREANLKLYQGARRRVKQKIIRLLFA